MVKLLNLLFCLVAFASGCVFVPVIQGVRDIGLTKDSRVELLSKQLKSFNDDIYWENAGGLRAVIDEEMPPDQRELLVEKRKGQKIVSSEVQRTDVNDDATEATVTVIFRKYHSNRLVVEECPEKQFWIFRAGKGWMIKGRHLEECRGVTI